MCTKNGAHEACPGRLLEMVYTQAALSNCPAHTSHSQLGSTSAA